MAGWSVITWCITKCKYLVLLALDFILDPFSIVTSLTGCSHLTLPVHNNYQHTVS